jgi:hypothetical protein
MHIIHRSVTLLLRYKIEAMICNGGWKKLNKHDVDDDDDNLQHQYKVFFPFQN